MRLSLHGGNVAALSGSNSVRWLVSALGVGVGGALVGSHEFFVAVAGVRGAYPLGTLLLLIVAALVIITWPRGYDLSSASPPRPIPALLTFCAGLAVLFWVASDLLQRVFNGPLDSGRGDMLVIMEHAIKRLLEGGNPYTVHHVPWDAPLTYGPVLWLPHLVSYLLRFDFRIFTLIAQLCIPTLCFVAAAVSVGQKRLTRASALFLLGIGAALHPDIRGFHQIGHTQVYWPVLAVFCVLLRQQRWTAASACLGLLASARTPLLALAPVFFLYLYVKDALTIRRATVFAASLVLPYLPFLVVDPAAVKNGMFDTYVRVMKTYVWQSTRWAVDTYGVTGRLLEHGKQQYVEGVQLLALGLTYVSAWRSMVRGTRVEPWLAFALLTFAMTTLWSVLYLYYDVWLLLACALVVDDGSLNALSARRPGRAILLALAIAAAVVLTAAAVKPGSTFKIDVGGPQAASYTGGGFGADVPETDNGRVVVWVEGSNGRIRLPWAGWTGGTIRLSIRPNPSSPGVSQSVLAALNGHALGRVPLKDGWQEIAFDSKRRHWLYGFNVLDLFFDYAAPRESSARTAGNFAAAIDFVAVD